MRGGGGKVYPNSYYDTLYPILCQAVSYDLVVERPTSSERAIERASRRLPSRRRVLCVVNRCDTNVEDVIKRIDVLSSISLIIILGRLPWLPSRDILSRPHLSPESIHRQATTLVIWPSPPLGGSVRGRLYDGLIVFYSSLNRKKTE